MSLAYPDVAGLLGQLSGTGLVLVGGQALNLWAERYRDVLPSGAFTSKDIDFMGSRQAVEAAAARVGGEARFSNTPMDLVNAGLVEVELGGRTIEINVLHGVFGVDTAEVESTALEAELPDGETFRVMHPFLVMESRFANVGGLHREDTHSLEQARVSVLCARHFAEERASAGTAREVLDLFERAFRYARKDIHARAVFATHGIDPFDAVQPLAALPKEFRGTRYPQMRSILGR